MYKLNRTDYEKVIPLFKGPHLNLVVTSVVEGNSHGEMWVDDVASPQTVFMWDRRYCYYLAGHAHDEEFNKNVEKILTEEIIPEAVRHDYSVFKAYYTSNEWERIIEDIFKERCPLKRARQFYTFKKVKNSWKIPPGCSVVQIDGDLLESTLKNVEEVTGEIESMWNSVSDFLKKGVGFCLVCGSEIVSWCTGEYFSKGRCGIGIETVEEYQRRGFATLTAAAFVDYCVSKNIAPHWDCFGNNAPSIRVAEKVGFEKVMEYTVYFGSFNDK